MIFSIRVFIVRKVSALISPNDATAVLKEQIEQNNARFQQDKAIEQQEHARVEQKNKEQKAVTLGNQMLTQEIEAIKNIMKVNKDIANRFDDVFASYVVHWLEMKNHKIELIDSVKVKPFDSNQLYVVERLVRIVRIQSLTIQRKILQGI